MIKMDTGPESSLPANLSGRGDANRAHFHALTRAEQVAAICRLANSGLSFHTIAAATGLAVEMIQSILDEAHHRA